MMNCRQNRGTGVVGVLCLVCGLTASAHEREKTQVAFTFQRDGSFVIEVVNDSAWLRDRMQSIPGPFADRIVLWVDGREVRPENVERIAGDAVSTHRLRGHLPIDARELRWYYGLVGDPYPLTIRRADGRIIVEEIGGDSWSRPIDVSGQFRKDSRWPIYVVMVLLVAGLALRLQTHVRSRQGHKG